MKVKRFEQYIHHSLTSNTYVVSNNDKCIIIDPGIITDELAKYLDNFTIESVLLTHGHYDHIGGCLELDVPTFIHELDEKILIDPKHNYSMWLEEAFSIPSEKVTTFKELDKNIIGLSVKSIHTPGHTKGSVLYKIHNYVFTGDTLFVDSIGRTDLYSSNVVDIQKSLKLIDNSLSNEDIICPGHGGKAKYKIVRKINPFIR